MWCHAHLRAGHNNTLVILYSILVPLGDYLGCHTDLKIRVELAQPILPNIAHPLLGGCPFSRLVYVVSGAGQLGIVRNLLDTVNEINGRALGLTGLSRDLLNAALSTCKLTR